MLSKLKFIEFNIHFNEIFSSVVNTLLSDKDYSSQTSHKHLIKTQTIICFLYFSLFFRLIRIQSKSNSKSLQELSALYWTQTNNEFIDEIGDNPLLKNAFDSLPNHSKDLTTLCEDIWIDINRNDRKPWNWGLF